MSSVILGGRDRCLASMTYGQDIPLTILSAAREICMAETRGLCHIRLVWDILAEVTVEVPALCPINMLMAMETTINMGCMGVGVTKITVLEEVVHAGGQFGVRARASLKVRARPPWVIIVEVRGLVIPTHTFLEVEIKLRWRDALPPDLVFTRSISIHDRRRYQDLIETWM